MTERRQTFLQTHFVQTSTVYTPTKSSEVGEGSDDLVNYLEYSVSSGSDM